MTTYDYNHGTSSLPNVQADNQWHGPYNAAQAGQEAQPYNASQDQSPQTSQPFNASQATQPYSAASPQGDQPLGDQSGDMSSNSGSKTNLIVNYPQLKLFLETIKVF